MDFEHKIYLARAQNELNLSVMVQQISDDKKIQLEMAEIALTQSVDFSAQ